MSVGPAETGDKVFVTSHGHKATLYVVGDLSMPMLMDGRVLDIAMSPITVTSRQTPGIVVEMVSNECRHLEGASIRQVLERASSTDKIVTYRGRGHVVPVSMLNFSVADHMASCKIAFCAGGVTGLSSQRDASGLIRQLAEVINATDPLISGRWSSVACLLGVTSSWQTRSLQKPTSLT